MKKCPHCSIAFHSNPSLIHKSSDVDGYWGIIEEKCPACKKLILLLGKYNRINSLHGPVGDYSKPATEAPIRPRANQRPLPSEVPKAFANDFQEAVSTLPVSPRASAALSRFCLQNLLRAVAGVKQSDLSNEIQEVLDSGNLPSGIAESIDAIRNIGNFAAHPNKSITTGEITAVEAHEAEWTLDVLEALFDYYFTQPERLKIKREALNKKLAETGKPNLK